MKEKKKGLGRGRGKRDGKKVARVWIEPIDAHSVKFSVYF